MKFFAGIFFLLILCISWVEGQEETTPTTKNICTESFLCDANYCSKCQAGKCAPHPNEDCKDGKLVRMYENKEDYCDCCAMRCVKSWKEGDQCDSTTSKPFVEGVCGPKLTCDATSRCVKLKTPCMKAQQDYLDALDAGTLGMDQASSECDDEGDWAAKQCTGNGVCRCVDTKRGTPTFGLATSLEEATEGKMNCGCSTELMVLKEIGCGMKVKYNDPMYGEEYKMEYEVCMKNQESYFPGHLRCLPNGNWDYLQCVPNVVEMTDNPMYNMENCFCMDDDLKVNSSMIPINLLDVSNILYCYDKDIHYPEYYRPCEAKHVEQRKKKELYKLEDKMFIATESLPACSPDGYFDKLHQDESDRTLGYCSDRMGNRIEDYEGKWAEMSQEDSGACECALVRKYTDVGGEKPVCDEDGSFRNW